MKPLLVCGMLAFCLSFPSAGQWLNYPTPNVPRTPDGKPNLSAACPRTPDGKPDLSGIWLMERNRPSTPTGLGCEPVSQEFINVGWSLKDGLPYQPWASELVKTRRADARANPTTHCLPLGIVHQLTSPLYRKVIQVPGLLVILSETNASYRQIFTDGRPLPIDPNPSWNGYSTAKWDGDTLVVQTSGFRDGIWLDSMGNPLTEAGRVTERFRRVTFGRLEIDITVDDPRAYTKPWTVTLNQTLVADTDLLDYVCNENEKDLQHLVPAK